MKYHPHQVRASEEALLKLHQQGMVAIFGLPRTGKTRTALRTAERYGVSNVLILTKKAAIPGWESEIAAVSPPFKYTLTNYEQIHNVEGDFDMLILDESHALGTRGKPSQRVKKIRKRCYHLPAIFLTGTPTIETPLGIYHQWCVTQHSPFDGYKSFYAFFNMYGVADPIWVNGRSIEQYKKHEPMLEKLIESYAVRISQEDAGIQHKAKDILHTVKLKDGTKEAIEHLLATGEFGRMIFDTDIGVRSAVHQIEAGAVLYEDQHYMLVNREVIDYLRRTFGDSPDVAYFTHYVSTRQKIASHFPDSQVFSSVAHAEGVDMSHMKHMVIVNTGYSGAKFAQLRERVVNMHRTSDALVHHIVTDAGLSKSVYDAVSAKKDYNLEAFRAKRARHSAPYTQRVKTA